jgi:hypothetical protein
MPRIAGHLQAEELELYCLGGLTENRCARLEEHLFLCDICRDRLTETEDYVAGMRRAGRQWSAEHAGESAAAVVSIRSWSGSWPTRLAPMLIAAALVVFAALWLGHHSNVQPPLPFAVGLTAVRGAAPGLVPAGRPLRLELDLTGLDGRAFAGEVVDRSGNRVATFPVAASAPLSPLAPGGYFVRINGNYGELLREYALTVER